MLVHRGRSFHALRLVILSAGLSGVSAAQQPHASPPARLADGERRKMVLASPSAVGLDSAQLEAGIAAIARQATAGRNPTTPGLVVVIGRHGKIVFNRGYGHLDPDSARSPRPDSTTVYDLASVTKVFGTTIAIMQLVAENKLRLDDPVNAHLTYWPHDGLAAKVRVGHLLTHTAGLGPGAQGYLDDMLRRATSKPHETETAKLQAVDKALHHTAGKVDTRQVRIERDGCYTDAAFVALGDIVQQVTGEPLDTYLQHAAYERLGLLDTRFFTKATKPDEPLLKRIASSNRPAHAVNDPIANSLYRVGKVAGSAGLFSSARDLALLSQELLDGAHGLPNRLVPPSTLQQFTTRTWPVTAADADGDSVRFNRDPWNQRGLGFDLALPTPNCPAYLLRNGECTVAPPWKRVNLQGEAELHTCAPDVTPVASLDGAFGHLGWTGPSVWIDPQLDMFVIVLMNHHHPHLYNEDDHRHVTLVRRPIDTLLARLTSHASFVGQ